MAKGETFPCLGQIYQRQGVTDWFCVNLTQGRVIREERALLWKCLHEIQLSSIFSASDQLERAWPIVGGAVPWVVVLGYVKAQCRNNINKMGQQNG